MRKQVNAARRRFQRNRNPILIELYKQKYLHLRHTYSLKLQDAKLNSWREFLMSINERNVWKKIYTNGIKQNFMKGIEVSGIYLPSGNCTKPLEETTNEVLNRNFLTDPYSTDNSFHRMIRAEASLNYVANLDPPFTMSEINSVIENLKCNKAPGLDSISNEILKQVHRMFPNLFSKIFNICLKLGSFPRCWKRANVVLIPKNSGLRIPHLDNLRCISLLPSLGKCLEKLFVNRITWFFHNKKLLNKAQFGFTPHKSCEDALLYLKDIVDEGKKKNLHTVLVFLDIKGAFDHAWWPGILVFLRKAGIPCNIFRLIKDFLHDRSALLSLGHVSSSRILERGCPQGSVSGPLLWNLIMNDLLNRLSYCPSCKTIAFADDLLICFQEKCPITLFNTAQNTLNIISNWSREQKLEFNPNKSKIMIIKRKHVSYSNQQLYLDNALLETVNEIKYLGVILDHKFCWKNHIMYLSNKCENILRGLNRVSCNTFGLKSNVINMIYKQGIVPFICYASRVWGTALEKKINSRILRRIQRRILLRVVRGYRTISYEACFVISGFPPIDLHVLNDKKFKDTISKFMFDTKVLFEDLPHPADRLPIQIIIDANSVDDNFPLVCYTDGSKINNRVGLAYVVFHHGFELEYKLFRIPNECSVFQAELLCISESIKWISNNYSLSAKFLIRTDSLSSLYSLRNIFSCNKLIVTSHALLKDLNNKGVDVIFSHVRGHTGNLGNERADWLAKQATNLQVITPMILSKSFFKSKSRDDTILKWNELYRNSTNASLTKLYFPSILHRLNNKHFLCNFEITQFLTGHGWCPPYIARDVKTFLLESLTENQVISLGCKIQWPSRSPDLTPTDFWLWGYLKSRAYRGYPSTLVELKNAIRLTVAAIDGDMLYSAVMGVVTSLTCLLPCGGGNAEHLLL
ncbi:Hypothetical protein in type-1 retrotransposable element R1DM, partial [Stegodyphus mimosarum]